MKISPAKINDTEVAMGVTFRPQFKQRMSECNGGEVQVGNEAWWLYPFWDDTDRRSIRRTAEDIRRVTEQLRSDEIGFPVDAIAIAHNAADDVLFLRTEGGAVMGEVWLFRLRGGTVFRALEDVSQLW